MKDVKLTAGKLWLASFLLFLIIMGGAMFLAPDRQQADRPQNEPVKSAPMTTTQIESRSAPQVIKPQPVVLQETLEMAADALGVKGKDLGAMQVTLDAVSSSRSRLPRRYTCKSRNQSPPYAWSGVPEDAKTLVLVMTIYEQDSDVWEPIWVVYNIPGTATALPIALNYETEPWRGVQFAENAYGNLDYAGPCDPENAVPLRVYLYALNKRVDLGERTSWPRLAESINGHVVGRTTLDFIHSFKVLDQ